jgi:hypothetical protein
MTGTRFSLDAMSFGGQRAASMRIRILEVVDGTTGGVRVC